MKRNRKLRLAEAKAKFEDTMDDFDRAITFLEIREPSSDQYTQITKEVGRLIRTLVRIAEENMEK